MEDEQKTTSRDEIMQLNNKLQDTKTELRVLQTKFDERNSVLIQKVSKLESELTLVLIKLSELNDLANSGRTSIKTLWFLGGVVTAGLAAIATWMEIFK